MDAAPQSQGGDAAGPPDVVATAQPGVTTRVIPRPRAVPARFIAGAVVMVVLGWVYVPELHWLWQTWRDDPNYSHGFLVVPTALVIFWRRRHLADPWETIGGRWGWPLLVLVLVARLLLYERGHQWASTITMLLALGCLALTFGGRDMLRRAWPAIAFLLFMVPLPGVVNDFLALPLQSMATSASTVVLKLTGLWVIAEGNVIYLGNQPLEVAEACNGLSMMMSLAAVTVAMVMVVPMSAWMRVILLLSALPVAFVSNVIRITVTAWCYHGFGPTRGAQLSHQVAGWLMMPLALVLVGLEMLLLTLTFLEEEVNTEPTLLGKPIVKDPAQGQGELPGPGRDGGTDQLALPPGMPGR